MNLPKCLLSLVLLPLAVVVCAGADAPKPAASPSLPVPQWLMDATRIAYTDLPNRDRQGDWPEKFIADLGAAKAQVLFSRVHSGEGWAGLAWRSEYGAADPAMGDRDGTREVLALCRKHGIRYVAYYWAQREPVAEAKAHPEWRCVNSKGKPTGYFCVNQPAYRELVRNRVVEMVAKVGVDGVFFDMFHARSDECYCPACKAKFHKLTGQEPPVKEDFQSLLWQQWVEFKYRTIEEAMLDFNRAIKAANPQAALVVNTWNAWVYRDPRNTAGPHNTRNSIRVAEVADALLEETGWYDSVDPSFFAFPTLHNFMSWHLGGLCKDKRALMWSSPSFLGAYPIGYPEASIRIATMLTNGSGAAQSVPGRDTMAHYMADLAEREPYLRGDRLYPWCGLVVSEKTELWYGREDPKQRYLKGVYGAFQTMLERHLPVSLVTDRELERGALEPYRVLFLPNCAAMGPAELESVRRFVRGGGGLVATYETSAYDEHARPRPTFGLADLFQAKSAGSLETQQIRFSWASPRIVGARLYLSPTHAWSNDPELAAAVGRHSATQSAKQPAVSLPLHCRMLLADSLKGPRSPIRIATSNIDKTIGKNERSEHAGLIETTYGKGRVIYLPADLTWACFRYGRTDLGRIVELALRQAAAAPPPVEVSAPTIVQAMTHVQGDRLVVHLLNDISSLGRSQNVAGESTYERREVIPMHDIRLVFRDRKYRRFTLVPGNQPLTAKPVPAGTEVLVPRLEIHSLVVAEAK
jgi:hypothetical protein